MTEPLSKEPTAETPPVRRFKDPSYEPVAPTLGQLRARIDALDERIIALLAERALCVRDATRFKRDAFQVRSPQRQAEVYARARSVAARQASPFPGFDELVESTYRTLVGGFIAGEGALLDQTEPLE